MSGLGGDSEWGQAGEPVCNPSESNAVIELSQETPCLELALGPPSSVLPSPSSLEPQPKHSQSWPWSHGCQHLDQSEVN